MTLLKKPLERAATAGATVSQPGRSVREPGVVADSSARRTSPLASRTAALLQRLHAQQHRRAAPSSVSLASEPGARSVIADVDLNRIQLTGMLGSEPLLYDVGDHPVATLALACERRWQATDGTLELETTWVNLSAWEELAEQCGRLLHRGDRVYVEGSLHLWTELQPPHSYACHTVIAERIVLLAAGSVRSDHLKSGQ